MGTVLTAHGRAVAAATVQTPVRTGLPVRKVPTVASGRRAPFRCRPRTSRMPSADPRVVQLPTTLKIAPDDSAAPTDPHIVQKPQKSSSLPLRYGQIGAIPGAPGTCPGLQAQGGSACNPGHISTEKGLFGTLCGSAWREAVMVRACHGSESAGIIRRCLQKRNRKPGNRPAWFRKCRHRQTSPAETEPKARADQRIRGHVSKSLPTQSAEAPEKGPYVISGTAGASRRCLQTWTSAWGRDPCLGSGTTFMALLHLGHQEVAP